MQVQSNIHEELIDENGSLNQFYNLTNLLVKTRHVRFMNKTDEAENIEWFFKYRNHPLRLQYSIYNGIRLSAEDDKDLKALVTIAGILKNKNR